MVTPERHQRVSELFARLCELKAEERSRVLETECAGDQSVALEVAALLRRDADPGPFLERPATEPGLSLLAPAAEAALGGPTPFAARARLGSYTIVRVIAAGGMGVVYEALQDHPHRTVALKVMRRGVRSAGAMRRFHLEAEMLGRLDHPGIARVYDAGVLRDDSIEGGGEDTPYFAMEFVQGRPLTEYADAHHLGRPERLTLFARVCDGVHHAHQRAVIHRDLKPANILVTEAGNPKILDFGVARAADPESGGTRTYAGKLLGTLAYMSPEQVEGDSRDVDVRADVYALGVILYELLAGRRPFALDDTSIPGAIRTVREAVPPPLDAADRTLRGDPATIVGKAMEKDRERRYQSAAELAADVRRYLACEPIAARPAGAMYQLVKFARRHKAGVGAAVVVAVTLVLGSVISTGLAVEATRARAASERALHDSLGVSGFLLDVFLGSPDEATFDRTALLERAEMTLNSRGVADPRLEAKVREFVGHGWLKLNYTPRAEPHLTRAVEIRRSLGAIDDDFVKSLHLLAMQRFAQGRIEEGRVVLLETLAHRRRLHGRDHLLTRPDEELSFYSHLYTPDASDNAADTAARLQRASQTPGAGVPVPATLPLVLDEGFDGSALDPGWRVEFAHALAWTSHVADSRLTATGIEPQASPGPTPAAAYVFVRRAIEAPLADFHVAARIGWDSGGVPGVYQAVDIALSGPGKRLMASAGYSDSFLQWEGARVGAISQFGEVGREVLRSNSGYNTLPASGAADVVLTRTGDRVTLWWDGHEILAGFSTDSLTEVAIRFAFVPYLTPQGTASFGTVWVDRVSVHGLPARPAAGP